MKETKTIEQIVEALKKYSWNVNATKKGAMPLKVVYPNEVILELFGKEAMKKYWID